MRNYLELADNDTLTKKFAGRTNWQGTSVSPVAFVNASGPLIGPIDLLRIDAEGDEYVLLSHILTILRPTNVVFNSTYMSPGLYMSVDRRLARWGYTYRGRSGDFVQYSRLSVLLVVQENWSTGSIAKDLKCASQWCVDYLNWNQYPPDLNQIIEEYDAVATFVLSSPSVWPLLGQHGVTCCATIEFPLLTKLSQKVLGGCFGSVSKELFYAMTKVDQSKEVYYTPASARATRFQRRPARPLKTIGWCGVPGCEKKFGGVDAKQFGVFEEIVKVSGLTPLVSYQNYTYDTMQDFYDALDLLVCTSSTEGGPLGIFEAVACGVPVISTNVGLVKELNFIKTFETIEEANELIEQLKDDTFRSEYTMHQYSQFIANWSMEQLVPHWEAFFNGCAKIHPGRVLQF